MQFYSLHEIKYGIYNALHSFRFFAHTHSHEEREESTCLCRGSAVWHILIVSEVKVCRWMTAHLLLNVYCQLECARNRNSFPGTLTHTIWHVTRTWESHFVRFTFNYNLHENFIMSHTLLLFSFGFRSSRRSRGESFRMEWIIINSKMLWWCIAWAAMCLSSSSFWRSK